MKKKVQKKKGSENSKVSINPIARINRKKVDAELVDIGKLSFIMGIILAIIIGFFVGITDPKIGIGVGVTYSIIFILGLIVGVLNITTEEVNKFLIAAITFLVAAELDIFIIKLSLPMFGAVISQMFFAMGVFVAPAATIVALKSIYELAKKR